MARDDKDSEKDDGKISRKKYEKRLKKLHGELVRLQEWVVHKGVKACIVFEGRDGAGKGGTIKALTDRVSPRGFASSRCRTVVTREEPDGTQRYLPHCWPPARYHWDRSWVQPRGRGTGDGLLSQDRRGLLKVVPNVERAIIESGVI
jgi:polyphosphate kinase 2 (PPK2 family)